MRTKKIGILLMVTAIGGFMLFRATPEVMARTMTSRDLVPPKSPTQAGVLNAVVQYAKEVGKGAITGAAAGIAATAVYGTPACLEAAGAGGVVGGIAGAASFVWSSVFGYYRNVTYPPDALDGAVFRSE